MEAIAAGRGQDEFHRNLLIKGALDLAVLDSGVLASTAGGGIRRDENPVGGLVAMASAPLLASRLVELQQSLTSANWADAGDQQG